ncbi:hypothetical protein [Aeromonas phage PVN04]|nr:hypothetical protein [Aeromonas phage PVN04]
MGEVRTKTIGTIIKFDPKTQFAEVKLSCNGTNSVLDQNYYNVDAAVLVDVPVEFPRCGAFVQTFPVRPGDDCIVEFFEQGITHWLYENRREYRVERGRPEAAARRKFSRSDAVCRVSMGNKQNAIQGFNSDGFEIRSWEGNQKLVFHPNGNIEMITPANIDMKAANINMEAKMVNINGLTIDQAGAAKSPVGFDGPSMKAAGKELADHKHSGVQRGNDETDVNK